MNKKTKNKKNTKKPKKPHHKKLGWWSGSR
jgi:hypothetical protein